MVAPPTWTAERRQRLIAATFAAHPEFKPVNTLPPSRPLTSLGIYKLIEITQNIPKIAEIFGENFTPGSLRHQFFAIRCAARDLLKEGEVAPSPPETPKRRGARKAVDSQTSTPVKKRTGVPSTPTSIAKRKKVGNKRDVVDQDGEEMEGYWSAKSTPSEEVLSKVKEGAIGIEKLEGSKGELERSEGEREFTEDVGESERGE